MTRLPLTCTSCGVALKGELDTFGEPDQPMCWRCWSELQFPCDSTPDNLNYWKIMGVKKQWEEMDKRYGVIV